jgi:hypothetical protein
MVEIVCNTYLSAIRDPRRMRQDCFAMITIAIAGLSCQRTSRKHSPVNAGRRYLSAVFAPFN